jgi:hypothetical protein
VGVQEVRWQGDGTEPAGEYIFSHGNERENHELGIGPFVHKEIISADKRSEFASDRSVVVRESFVTFRNKLSFQGEDLLAPRPTPNWKTTRCRLSATAYSI